MVNSKRAGAVLVPFHFVPWAEAVLGNSGNMHWLL